MKTYAFIAAACMLALAACSATPKGALIGKWETDEGAATLLFSEDGSFAASAPGGVTRGTYLRTEDEKLEMEFDGISTRVAISVADDQLTFCPEGHGCERLRKVR